VQYFPGIFCTNIRIPDTRNATKFSFVYHKVRPKVGSASSHVFIRRVGPRFPVRVGFMVGNVGLGRFTVAGHRIS
jgi:hypothetical protein